METLERAFANMYEMENRHNPLVNKHAFPPGYEPWPFTYIRPYIDWFIDSWPWTSSWIDFFIVSMCVFNAVVHMIVTIAMLFGGLEAVWNGMVANMKFEKPGCGLKVLITNNIVEMIGLAVYFLSDFPSASTFLFASQIFSMCGADWYNLSVLSRPAQWWAQFLRFFTIESPLMFGILVDVGETFEVHIKVMIVIAAKLCGYGWCRLVVYLLRDVLKLAKFELLPVPEEDDESKPKPKAKKSRPRTRPDKDE